MKNKILRTGCVWLVLLVFSQGMQAQSAHFRTGRSIDLLHNILREVSVFYVDTVQMDQLVNIGIASMLEHLDPYTEFIPEEDNESIELMTTGTYGGVGSLIQKTPNGVIFTDPYEGSPAVRAGIVVGDLILEIDGVPATELSVDECSRRLKGMPGTDVRLKIKKVKTGETAELTIRRERIHFPDIAYYGILDGGVGYIRITGFTLGGGQELRNAFLELQASGKMSTLVLDLRGNGGGPVEEAVNMLGLFLPRATEVLSVKGRYPQQNMTYKTKDEPLDVHIPIAVLVNRGSASSSEILAGAIQDLDRGIVVGTRTFGKGLVQSFRPLQYNAKLKMTTGKYYTPSGRCVQAIDYSHRNEDGSVGYVPDSLIQAFKTRNGRPVFDGGGISPDIRVEPEPFSRLAIELLSKNLIRDYAIQYFAARASIAAPELFELSDAEYEDFISFMEDREFDGRSATEALLEQLVHTAKREGYDSLTLEQIEAVKEMTNGSKAKDLQRHKAELKRLLEEEICSAYYHTRGRIRSMLREDVQLSRTIEVLSDSHAYRRALAPPSVE
ncbi:MAG: S41 family peptidase [Bacteroidales bacterium]|nr:S41 family peptidase [Bacteroidales bacterium]